MKSKLEKAILESMIKNPNNWNGIFYHNPQDPRVLVPKIKPSMGWTFNWASPYSYISFVCIVLITVAAIVFL
jgi:uncharacterized membrane protein